jgi:hypothetical protein
MDTRSERAQCLGSSPLVCCFQRNHPIYRNGYGRFVWIIRTTYSKGCHPLNFFKKYIKPVYSRDLYVISLFHGSLPLALGFSEQMRRANFVVLQQHYA